MIKSHLKKKIKKELFRIIPKDISFLLENVCLVALIIIVLFFGIYSSLFWKKNHRFYSAELDMASELDVLYNSIKGKLNLFLFSSIHEGYFFIVDHLNLTFVLLFPIFWIFPSKLTYFFLHGIILSIGVIPLYKISELKLKSKLLAFICSCIYLFNPILIYFLKKRIVLRTYMAIPFLFFTWYFYEKKKFKPFILFLFFSVFTKENISLLSVMMGLFLLYKEENKKWGISAIFLGILALMSFFLFISGLFGNLYSGGRFKSHFGEGFVDNGFNLNLIKNRILSPEKIVYIRELFSFFGFISFLGPEILLVNLPKFFENLLYVHQDELLFSKNNAILLPFLFISFVYGLKRLKKVLELKISSEESKMILLIILSFLILNVFCRRAYFKGGWRWDCKGVFSRVFSLTSPEDREGINWECEKNISNYNKRWNTLLSIKKDIPDSTRILIDRSLSLAFAERTYTYIARFPLIEGYLNGHKKTNYILFNRELINCLKRKKDLDSARREISAVNVSYILKNPEWEKILEKDGFILFKKHTDNNIGN